MLKIIKHSPLLSSFYVKQLTHQSTHKKESFSMFLHISQIQKMASSKCNCYGKTPSCSVKTLAFVIVNEVVSSGLYAVVPTIAAQGNTND